MSLPREPAAADPAALTAELRERALALGFLRVGAARATPLVEEGARLRAWIEAGYHGGMAWMERTADVRADPGHPGMLRGARSVFVLAAPYMRLPERVGLAPGVVARYARGRDYHNVLKKRARKLVALLRERGHEARASVDAEPVFERAWAARAGVGFIGKNCCLIVPGLGSHVFLSTVITTAELVEDSPIKERCGTCRACLDTCPTRAFVAPRTLDSRRCVSYLTIEHEGPIPEEHRAGVGEWLFGCDACQDVCPFNATTPEPDAVTAPFAPHARFAERDAAWLLTAGDDDFTEWAQGSPLRRAGRRRMARNAAITLANHRDRRHLPVLAETSRAHDDPTVRQTARDGVQKFKRPANAS